jgi:RND family efflux transporter MFP subunit
VISEEELRKAEAILAEAKHEWERSRLIEDRARISTPISGIILRLARDQSDVPVADGQLVTPGFQVAQVAPMIFLVADVDLVGPELGRVRPGLEARIRHYAFDGVSFPGEVIRLSPSIDPKTHSFRAEVEVANERRLLRPGMFVEVTLVAERREGVPVVDREAVTERGGRRVVFLIEGQRVAEREVLLGLGDDAVVEVRRGLEPGERIVARGLETLTDGTRVRVTE